MATAGAATIVLGLYVLADAASASPVRSRLTTIDLPACTPLRREGGVRTWRCNGLRGYPVIYSEADDRAYISFGADGAKRLAARQSLLPPNTIFEAPGHRATIEWRFRRIGNADVPYATIIRYFTSGNSGKGEALVVTKVSASEACHVAYLDAKANAEAMALARQAADELARGWSCAPQPRIIGARGASPQ
jgi:hypothetical protein